MGRLEVQRGVVCTGRVAERGLEVQERFPCTASGGKGCEGLQPQEGGGEEKVGGRGDLDVEAFAFGVGDGDAGFAGD